MKNVSLFWLFLFYLISYLQKYILKINKYMK